METKHTPGETPTPWTYNNETHYIYDANGNLVLNCLGAVAGDGDVIGKILVSVNTAAERDRLREALALILDNVDYTAGRCRINEMIAAILPKEIIQIARDALDRPRAEGEINHG